MRISFLFRTLVTIILLIIIIIRILSFASNKLETTYLEIASLQTKKIVSRLINEVIDNHLLERDFEAKKDDSGIYSYDIKGVNELVSDASKEIIMILDDINHNDYSFLLGERVSNYDEKGIVYEIPFSLIGGNSLFSSLGPLLPVKFNLLGDVLTKARYNIESFGVNNALITLFMNVSFSFGVYLPLGNEIETLDIDIPLAMNIIEGDVPSLIGKYDLEV